MHSSFYRNLCQKINKALEEYPVIALLGPRQCGKSTLAKDLISRIENTLYIDLELPSDRNKLENPELFFTANENKMVCLDEIQLVPDIFAVMRGVCDQRNRSGQFLILGSASETLLRQSSESLAGRIAFFELTPFLFSELKEQQSILQPLWLRGGFPRSYLAKDDAASFFWRGNYVRTFIERDLPQLGITIPAHRISRFWQICAHLQGQLLNSSKLGESMGLSHHTIRSYMELLEKTFMIRLLQPFSGNVKKRLVKSPKIYVRDSGIVHGLLGIESFNDLLGHPIYGSSWEGFVVEQICSDLAQWRPSFYRTSAGAEIDLLLERGNERIAIECKTSSNPKPSRHFYHTMEELNISKGWIIAPIQGSYPIAEHVNISSLRDFLNNYA